MLMHSKDAGKQKAIKISSGKIKPLWWEIRWSQNKSVINVIN